MILYILHSSFNTLVFTTVSVLPSIAHTARTRRRALHPDHLLSVASVSIAIGVSCDSRGSGWRRGQQQGGGGGTHRQRNHAGGGGAGARSGRGRELLLQLLQPRQQLRVGRVRARRVPLAKDEQQSGGQMEMYYEI